jgi:integrase
MAKKKSRESWGIVDRLPSGRYRARYTHLETRFKAPHTFDTVQDARDWLSGTRSDISRGKWVDPRKVVSTVFGSYAEHWIKTRVTSKGQPLRPKTRVEYERQLERGLAPLASKPLADITPSVVRGWHSARSKEGLTAAGNEARLLRAILNTAVEDKLLDENPVASKLCRTSTGKKHRPPTLGELVSLIDAMPEELRLAIVIAAYGGCRLSEWRGLTRQDVKFVATSVDGPEQVVIRIHRQVQWVRTIGWEIGDLKGKLGDEREAVLPAALTPAIKEHLEKHVGPSPDSLLFEPAPRYEYLTDSTFNRKWDKAREAAEVKGEVREHDLRGFAGTMHAQAGATLRETMAFLGHSTTVAAMAYQATTGREAELANRMPVPSSLLVH